MTASHDEPGDLPGTPSGGAPRMARFGEGPEGRPARRERAEAEHEREGFFERIGQVRARRARRAGEDELAVGHTGQEHDHHHHRGRRLLRRVPLRYRPALHVPARPDGKALRRRLRKLEVMQQWFILHTYSGHEKKVRDSLKARVRDTDLQSRDHRGARPDRDGGRDARQQARRVVADVLPRLRARPDRVRRPRAHPRQRLPPDQVHAEGDGLRRRADADAADAPTR